MTLAWWWFAANCDWWWWDSDIDRGRSRLLLIGLPFLDDNKLSAGEDLEELKITN